MSAVHSCEAFDDLVNSNNNFDVAQALDGLRQLVSADDYAAVPESYWSSAQYTAAVDSYWPGSPNQLSTPGMQVGDWSRDRTDTTPEAVVAQITPLGHSPLAPAPPLDAGLLRAATEFFTTYSMVMNSMYMKTLSPTAVPATSPVASSGVGSGAMVPMQLGNREVHIPLERVVPTQGSNAYFASVAQYGRGIGRSACRHWLQKRCTYGEKCDFMHVKYLDAEQQQMFDEYLLTLRTK